MDACDVVVIGGGPAGLAAAITAQREGASVCLIERESRLGGILKQCIHDGFGLVRFHEKLSGPEYAERFIREFTELDIPCFLSTFVTSIRKDEKGFDLSLVSKDGISHLRATSLILATGCRERTPRQVGIHGTRPAGLINAGSAQNYVNLLGKKIGNRCVILGSGDIGLIMARRLTLEGATVLGVFEIMGHPAGLARNVQQCLEDFQIPLHLSTTVTKVFGEERVEAVQTAKVDDQMNPIPGTEQLIPCDTLVVSVGLIPENELAEMLGVDMDPVTHGPICNRHYETSAPGVFACGNCFHVFDLVDYVSGSGEVAGKSASLYVRGCLPPSEPMEVRIPPKKIMSPGKLVCIGCPKGCEMDVKVVNGHVEASGNSCPKGLEFAIAEMTHPSRVLCTTVRTDSGKLPVLPVRTEKEIPKSLLLDAMREINQVVVHAPIQVGDVVVFNLLNTGVNVIATEHLEM